MDRKYTEFTKKLIAKTIVTTVGGTIFIHSLSDGFGHLDPPPSQVSLLDQSRVNITAVSTTTASSTSWL